MSDTKKNRYIVTVNSSPLEFTISLLETLYTIHDGSTELIAKNDNTCNNNMGKIEVSILSGGLSRMAIQKKSYNTIQYFKKFI